VPYCSFAVVSWCSFWFFDSVSDVVHDGAVIFSCRGGCPCFAYSYFPFHCSEFFPYVGLLGTWLDLVCMMRLLGGFHWLGLILWVISVLFYQSILMHRRPSLLSLSALFYLFLRYIGSLPWLSIHSFVFVLQHRLLLSSSYCLLCISLVVARIVALVLRSDLLRTVGLYVVDGCTESLLSLAYSAHCAPIPCS
jgi:hypothetical protein